MVLKGKVVYDFQSVEFEEDVKDLELFFGHFEAILKGLSQVANKYPQPTKTPQKSDKTAVKKESKASPNQIRWLINLGVDEEEARQMTTSEASALIKELKEIGSNG